MCAVETGLEFLDRLKLRPTLDQLHTVLFPEGLKPKEVVELSGGINCGKTLLLTELIVKCILPKSWNNISVKGLDSGVILLNIDHHFQIFKLTELIEHYLNNCKYNVISNQLTEGFDTASKESIIKYSLNNLVLLNIYDSFQLKMTSHLLKQLIAENGKINLILMDSICCNYWQDNQSNIFGNVKKVNLYISNVLRTIQRNIIDFNVCFIYTRSTYFKSAPRFEEPTRAEPGFNNVTRRINLKPINELGNKITFCCTITTSYNKTIKFYDIGPMGFKWIE